MYLQQIKYEINTELEGLFIGALLRNCVSRMRDLAGPLLSSIKTGAPKVFIPNEVTIKFWEDKSLAWLDLQE